MAHNFWDDIVSTEQKAKDLIEKAKKDKEEELIRYAKKLQEDKEAAVASTREKEREYLKEKQVESKKLYKDLVSKGGKDMSQRGKDAEGHIDREVKGAADYLLNTLLGVKA
ncbi:MAG TPA: hypothetical protein VIT68_03585 [Candidatus Gracilibacteria bacterium]